MRGVRGGLAEHPDRLLHRYDDYSEQDVQRDLLRRADSDVASAVCVQQMAEHPLRRAPVLVDLLLQFGHAPFFRRSPPARGWARSRS